MSLYAENYDGGYIQQAGGFYTQKPISTTSTLAVTGAATLGSTLAVTGASTLSTVLYKDLTEVVAATNVITAAETGSVFFLNSSTEFVSTLPAVAAGLHFTFIVTAAPSGASYTVVAASGTPIKGQVLTLDVNSGTDPGFSTSGVLTVTFVDGKSVAGDKAEFWCDGTNWFVVANCSVFDAITLS